MFETTTNILSFHFFNSPHGVYVLPLVCIGHMSLSSGPLTPDWPPTATGRLTVVASLHQTLSHFFVGLSLCLSGCHCLTFCAIVSLFLLGDEGQTRSAWIRAVSRRRIGSIYSLVCSGPFWPKGLFPVCLSMSVSLPLIYLLSMCLLLPTHVTRPHKWQ